MTTVAVVVYKDSLPKRPAVLVDGRACFARFFAGLVLVVTLVERLGGATTVHFKLANFFV